MWAAWWYCPACVRMFHVPSTGYFGQCPGCGKLTIPILAPATEMTPARTS
jgi:hypothetical protein